MSINQSEQGTKTIYNGKFLITINDESMIIYENYLFM